MFVFSKVAGGLFKDTMTVKKIETEQERAAIAGLVSKLDMKTPWMFKLVKFRKKRTLSQNALYHLWKAVIAKELGYTPNEMHEALRGEYLGFKNLDVFDKELTVINSTNDLNTKQFKEFLDCIHRDFSAQGIILPMPGDRGLEEMYEKYKDTF